MIAAASGHGSVGRALVVYSCAFMAACGLVLFASDRRLWRGAIGQTVPPLIAVLAALV
jgi:putative membrane protein